MAGQTTGHFDQGFRFRDFERLTQHAFFPPIMAIHGPTSLAIETRIANVFAENWSGREDLNLRPLGPEPTEYAYFLEEKWQILFAGNHRVTISPRAPCSIRAYRVAFAVKKRADSAMSHSLQR
jgi:hypothetical protein